MSLLFFLLPISCKKDGTDTNRITLEANGLPVRSKKGLNTLGFIIDKGVVYAHDTLSAVLLSNNDGTSIFRLEGSQRSSSISIDFDSIKIEVGLRYTLGERKKNEGLVKLFKRVDYRRSAWDFYGSSREKTGYIIFTYFDPDKQILSGEFEAKVGQFTTTEIKEGRFDVKYQTQRPSYWLGN